MPKIRRIPLIIAFDTETYKEIEKEIIDGKEVEFEVNKIYLTGWATSLEPTKLYYSTEPHLEFFNFLTEMYEKGYKLELWVYNGNYDLPILLKDYLCNFPEAEILYKNTDRNRYICCSYQCEYFKFSCDDAALWDAGIPNLSDWFKLLGLPDKLSDNFDYNKDGPLNFDGINFHYYHKTIDENGNVLMTTASSNLKEELEYLERDVLGLLEVVKYQRRLKLDLCKECKVNPLFGWLPKTAPSFSKEVIDLYMKQHYNISDYFDNTFRPIIDDSLYEIYNNMERSSIGGFTTCNKDLLYIYTPEGNIQSFDVNSMYPSIMVKGLPVGEFLYSKPLMGEYTIFYEVHVTTNKWIDEFSFFSTPPTPESWNTYEGNVYMTKNRYEAVKDIMEGDLKILEVFYMKLDTTLTPFLETIYNKKVECELIEDKLLRAQQKGGYKILMNGLYGKTCQKVFKEEKVYSLESKCFQLKDSLQKNGEKWPYRSLMAGVYISQESQAVVINAAVKERKQGNIILYCDTDSIKMIQNKKPLLNIHNTKLGYWKHEGCGPEDALGYTHYLSLGVKKKYFLTNEGLIQSGQDIGKLTFSGVSKTVQKQLVRYLTLDQMIFIFDRENNIEIKGGKIQKFRNKYGEVVLKNSDIKINAKCTKNGKVLPASHELKIDKDRGICIIKKL